MPPIACLAICIGTVGFHLLASYILLLPLYKKSGDGIVRRIMRGVVTLVNIPLFCDWEEFFRDSDFSLSVSECWKKSKKLYAKFQVLFLIEHMVSLAPMIWLKVVVDQRNAELEDGPFKPVPDEELSTDRVNLLLALGIAVPLAGALLQALFAYLYFRFGHPWARVLNSQVLTVKHDSNPTLCSRFTEYLNIVEGIFGK